MKRLPTAQELADTSAFEVLLDNLALAEKVGMAEDASLFREAIRILYQGARDKYFSEAVDIVEKSGPGYDKYLQRQAAFDKLSEAPSYTTLGNLFGGPKGGSN